MGRYKGFLTGATISPGMQPPDGGVDVDLIVPEGQLPAKMAEASALPKVRFVSPRDCVARSYRMVTS